MPRVFRSSDKRQFRPAFLDWLASLTLMLAISVGWLAASSANADDRLASLLIDAGTGEILESTNADMPRYPASLTKMMTLYLTFESLQEGRLTLDQRLYISPFAASQAPTKVGLPAGNSISVENAILALVTKSANDMAVVIAEAIGGSESEFARLMTAKARQLGMVGTVFYNASGLPDPYQMTTARDMATLARALLLDYPQYYPYFSTRYFNFGGRLHANHNRLLNVYDGMDGIKTGYTRAAGYNLVASAQRDGRRLIGVVLGARSSGSRGEMMTSMLDTGFYDHGVAFAENRRVAPVQPSAPEVVGHAPTPAWTTAYAAPPNASAPVTLTSPALTPVAPIKVATAKSVPERWMTATSRTDDRRSRTLARHSVASRSPAVVRGRQATARVTMVAQRDSRSTKRQTRVAETPSRKPIVLAQATPRAAPFKISPPPARPASAKSSAGSGGMVRVARVEPSKVSSRASCYKIGNRPIGC